MKALRIAIIAAVIIFAVFQSGCRTTWSLDFTEAIEEDLADWGGYSSWALDDPPGSGLQVEEYYVLSPIGFSADFTLTLDMWMDIDDSNSADFRIWIGDDESDYPEHYITCEFEQAGDEINEEVLIHEDGVGLDFRDIDTLEPIPGIKNGTNTFKLIRRGDHIRITMNGAELADFDAIYFNPPACFVGFVTDDTSSQDVYYRKISVSYAGDPVPLP